MEVQPPPGHLIKQINNFVYNTESIIGKGYSSAVYKGLNSQTKEIVAIKVMDIRSAKNDIEKMLIANEIKALSTVSHENVIRCYEVCQTVNNIYVVMENCTQGTLSDFIKSNGKVREDQALAILSSLAQGVHHIHTKGFLHRDLKPTNILLKNGVPKIADFGFAVPSNRSAQSFYNVGSPLYMSPEAYKKSEYSTSSDVWGLGVIFYEMLLGGAPFKGIDYDTMIGKVQSGELFRALAVSPLSRGLLEKMLCVPVQQRITTNELLALLEPHKKYNSKLGASSPPVPYNEPPHHLQPLQCNGSQSLIKAKSPLVDKQNFSAKVHPSIIHTREGKQLPERILLGRLLNILLRTLVEFDKADKLIPLVLKHWKFNTDRLQQLGPTHPDVVNEKQRLLEGSQEARFPISDSFLRYLCEKGVPESETYSDFTLFWLRTSIRQTESALEQLQNFGDGGAASRYFGFLLMIRYCQVVDHMRQGEAAGVFPQNEVLDWLIQHHQNVTPEAVEYLRAICKVLVNFE